MSKEEFVARAIAVFPQLKEVEYLDAFIGDIGERFLQGWEFKDVLSYLRTFEEVNPETEEELALRRRAAIEAKYLDGNVELHDAWFSSLAPLVSK